MQQGGGSLGRRANGEAWACATVKRRGDSGVRGTGEDGGNEPLPLCKWRWWSGEAWGAWRPETFTVFIRAVLLVLETGCFSSGPDE